MLKETVNTDNTSLKVQDKVKYGQIDEHRGDEGLEYEDMDGIFDGKYDLESEEGQSFAMKGKGPEQRNGKY